MNRKKPFQTYCQCPRCLLEGEIDIFKDIGWPEKARELIMRKPGQGIESDLSSMSYQDAYGLYLRLLRQGN
jgi:hypothetical protein